MSATIGSRVMVLDSVDSTMDEARRMGLNEEGAVIVARKQSNARGRLGRTWHSPVGGLWFTIVVIPKQSATTSPLLSLAASLAVARGITAATGLPAAIRWPNDVYIHGGKVAGVLTELEVVGDVITRAFVGVGVNANFELDELPEEIRSKTTTILRELGRGVSLDELLAKILKEFNSIYETYKTGWHDEILREVKENMELLGSPVVVTLTNGTLIGVLEDIDELGRIILRLDQDRIQLSPGDVERIAPA
ncbi:MAG: biotin--[acetyl-CoA-carboxylase] ligase [Aigarchaeota archaeon]|nr:biotin--[acetyl-CoA-carboxylase] ligase [Candidatus Pelearchaeum maunauluense]